VKWRRLQSGGIRLPRRESWVNRKEERCGEGKTVPDISLSGNRNKMGIPGSRLSNGPHNLYDYVIQSG
jgi:hypothetical protein